MAKRQGKASQAAGDRRARIIAAITALQDKRGVLTRAGYARALDVLMDVSHARAGAVAEARREGGALSFLVRASAGAPSVAALADRAGLAFEAPDRLSGALETLEAPVIIGEAEGDACLAAPLRFGGELIGLCLLAGPPAGYDADLPADLAPLTAALAALAVAGRKETLAADHHAGAAVSGDALAAVGLPAWRWDRETGLFSMDARFAALLDEPDLAHGAFTQDQVMSVVHPDDHALVGRELDEVFTHRTHSFCSDHRLVTLKGRTIWVRAHAELQDRPGGGAPVAAGVVVDRTDAKQTELALARANERFDLAVNGSNIAIWDGDLIHDTLVWSDEVLRILGVDRETLLGRSEDFTSRLHPDDFDAVQAALTAHFEDGAPYDMTYRMRHAAGRWVTVRARGDSVRDASGRAIRMAGSMLDLTAEQEAQRATADAMAKMNLAASHAGIGPIEIDVEAQVLRGDASLATLMGQPDLREISFEQAMAIVHPDDLPAVQARQARLLDPDQDRFESEHRVMRPDGTVVWQETVTMVTRRDENGFPTLLSGVVIDHTSRKQVERELARAKERNDLAVDASHMALWDHDLVTGQAYWSARMGEILGLGRVERHEDGASFLARIHPDDLPGIRCAYQSLIKRDAPYDVTMRLQHADGGYVPVRSRAGVLRNDAGEPIRVCGSVSDISAEVMACARADIAVEAARLGITDWDIASGTITADLRFASLLGRPWLADRPGSPSTVERYSHPDDREMVLGLLADLEAGRSARVEFEHRVIQPDGAIVWVGGNASVVDTDSQGLPRRVLGVFEDRTARKSAEIELAEAKQRYDFAVSGAHTAIWDHDLRTGALYWSARLGEILGLGSAEQTETLEDFLERVHPDDRARTRAQTGISVKTGTPLDLVMRVQRADGAYRHLRARAGVMRDETGRPTRVCGSATDVTEEIEAEAKARLSGRRAELALKAAHLGVWEYDADTGMTTIDSTLANLVAAPHLAGRPMTQDEILIYDHPDDAARLRRDFVRILEGDLNTTCVEYRQVRTDGGEVWVRADVGVAERAPDGSVTRLIGIVQDLSAAKLTEELLRKTANAEKKANEAKSQFLATMSHEIRTPLNGVLGVVQLLERTPLDPRQRRYVDTIKASGRSLSDVIEDVLDISRIEAGRLQLKPVPTLVSDILAQAAAPSRAAAADKGVQLTLEVDDALSKPVYIDPRRVAQMTANLISNAVKFTEVGGVRVTARRPVNGVLRIEVDDDGPGLPEDMHEAVFDRFVQADMSHSRAHEGSGLGLAIVRELAKLAGGVAGVRSQPGQGACFWVELPAPAAPALDEDPEHAAPVAVFQELRVLVVEDHPVNRAVTAELVTQAGHRCETADTGEEALSVLRARAFDVVLLDLHMPGMDGKETLARIRRGEAGAADLPVYIVTADATPQAREETGALGADGFFVKPLDAEALGRTLTRLGPGTLRAG